MAVPRILRFCHHFRIFVCLCIAVCGFRRSSPAIRAAMAHAGNLVCRISRLAVVRGRSSEREALKTSCNRRLGRRTSLQVTCPSFLATLIFVQFYGQFDSSSTLSQAAGRRPCSNGPDLPNCSGYPTRFRALISESQSCRCSCIDSPSSAHSVAMVRKHLVQIESQVPSKLCLWANAVAENKFCGIQLLLVGTSV
jgi:hypothetical protein